MMLKFVIEMEELAGPVGGLDMGHFTLQGSKAVATSAGKDPSQAMMVFISIIELLDGLKVFLFSKKKNYVFIGADSSFSLLFEKLKNNDIRISSGGTLLGVEKRMDLVAAIWRGVDEFLENRLNQISSDDMVYNDLISSVDAFKRDVLPHA